MMQYYSTVTDYDIGEYADDSRDQNTHTFAKLRGKSTSTPCETAK